MKRIIVLILAGIGSLTLLGFLAAYLVSGFIEAPDAHDFNLVSNTVSPKGDFKVMHYRGMGGGAAGWCNEIVSVEPAKSDGQDKFSYRVFTISCGAPIDIRWLGDYRLHIAFAPKRESDGTSIDMRKTDKSKKIAIEYTMNASGS